MSKDAKTAPKKAETVSPVFALHKINGLPAQRIFRPESKEQLDELFRLEAVRELTEAEAALFEKTEAAAPKKSAGADDDVVG